MSNIEGGNGDGYELVPGGASQPVTPDNVYQYVKLYAELRMVRVCHDSLLVSSLLTRLLSSLLTGYTESS